MRDTSQQRQNYSSHLSVNEWQRLKPLVPAPKHGGRPAKYEPLEVLNAILYLVRTGCAWRLLPHDFPPWRIVYHYFSSWRRDGIWSQFHDALRTQVRIAEGREAEPSAAILDSQSVKTTEKGGSMDMMPAKDQRPQTSSPRRNTWTGYSCSCSCSQHSGS